MASPKIQAKYVGRDTDDYKHGQTYTFRLDGNEVIREDADGDKALGPVGSFSTEWEDIEWLENMEVIE